jgi:uncharacterized cupin superfamily protein
MSFLKTIEQNPTFAPRRSEAAPERLIEGHPTFQSWNQDEDKDGRVQTGVWEATLGLTHSIKGEVYEFCYILFGKVELTPKDGEPVTYGPGDSFVLKPGWVGTWRTIETVRKIYVTVT